MLDRFVSVLTKRPNVPLKISVGRLQVSSFRLGCVHFDRRTRAARLRLRIRARTRRSPTSSYPRKALTTAFASQVASNRRRVPLKSTRSASKLLTENMGDLQELAPNTLVGNGRYRVGEEINRGGTAVVYEGFDNALAMRVALKVRACPSLFTRVVVSSAYRHRLTSPSPRRS